MFLRVGTSQAQNPVDETVTEKQTTAKREDDGRVSAYEIWRSRLIVVPAGDEAAFCAGWQLAKDKFQQN